MSKKFSVRTLLIFVSALLILNLMATMVHTWSKEQEPQQRKWEYKVISGALRQRPSSAIAQVGEYKPEEFLEYKLNSPENQGCEFVTTLYSNDISAYILVRRRAK